MALSAANRLSLKKNRSEIFDSGKSIYSPLLQVIYLKSEQLAPLFSVIVSKKVAKKAHQRNRIRRQLHQLIQTNISSFPPYKYIFLPKKATPVIYSELKASFTQLVSSLRG